MVRIKNHWKGTEKEKESKRKMSEARKRNPTGIMNGIKSRFKRGQKSKNWNGIKKGEHISNQTEFKKGQKASNKGKKMPQYSGKKHWNWQGGKSLTTNYNKLYSVDWTETLKRSIRERDNYICQLCSQYGQFVHHIDYNKLNCNPDNLITLCGKCNSKVNFNRKYWTEYFSKQ